MAKIRVHEIAKEYDVTAKEVINFLHGHNIEVTNLKFTGRQCSVTDQRKNTVNRTAG